MRLLFYGSGLVFMVVVIDAPGIDAIVPVRLSLAFRWLQPGTAALAGGDSPGC